MTRNFLRLIICAGWAPVAVLILHALLAKFHVRQLFDHTLHFLGGFSMAFFLFVAISIFRNSLGHLTAVGHYLFAFTFCCTVAVFWEFGEYFSDVYLGTHIQFSIAETLQDLICGTLGASGCLVVIFLISIILNRTGRT